MIFRQVERLDQVDEDIFNNIISQTDKRPLIIKNCSFGDCLVKWNLNYLNNKLQDNHIVIHESDSVDLDFLGKNFIYKSCTFQEFANQLQTQNADQPTSKSVYLRSTNKNYRSKKPARIEDDFPSLREDLKPASFIPFGELNKLYHSSILRIASSSVQIWTHFDLYDNVLVQVVGIKRIILFPPNDIEFLYVTNDKSRVKDLDNWEETSQRFPMIKNTTPYKCLLNPGETLFIPALWWHNIKTTTTMDPVKQDQNQAHSIGFNIFWKDSTLESTDGGSLYSDCDVYGNKNLKPVDFALTNMDKAINHIDRLPGKYKNFYKHFLLQQLQSKLFPT